MVGYKIVSDIGSDKFARSLFGEYLIPLVINARSNHNRFYLGTSRKFVIDYYSGCSEYPDLLLSYEYEMDSVISGDVNSDGEIVVTKCRLISVEKIQEVENEDQDK